MQVRRNTVYYESFAIALSAADFESMVLRQQMRALNMTNIDNMLENVDWAGLRDRRSIRLHEADALVRRIRHHHSTSPLSVQANNSEVACLFVTHASGRLNFFCPQASTARLRMNASQLASEKTNLIRMMIRSGRRGGRATEDQYGGDNRDARIRDHRFDWTFPH